MRYCEVICAFFKGKTFGDITPMLVEHFKKQRREGLTRRGTKRNMATVNRELAQLSKIFSLAVDNDYCQLNPCRKVRRYRVDNRRERVLTSKEETEFLPVLAGVDAPLRAVALLALNTGIRRGEMMELCWADVDFEGRMLHIPRAITKNGRGRSLPLNDAACAALAELKQSAGIEARVLAGVRYCKATLSQKFGAAATAAGLADVTLHTLRHTFATRLKDAGVDPFTVRDLLGHATIEMTNHYTHATPDTMRRGVETLAGAARESARIVPVRRREVA